LQKKSKVTAKKLQNLTAPRRKHGSFCSQSSRFTAWANWLSHLIL